jgi:hypothetical protein
VTLLKTPTSNLGVNGGSQHPDKRKSGGHGPNLADEVEHLLPTPLASDGAKGSPKQRHGNGDRTLPSIAASLLPPLPGTGPAPSRPQGRRTSRSRGAGTPLPSPDGRPSPGPPHPRSTNAAGSSPRSSNGCRACRPAG